MMTQYLRSVQVSNLPSNGINLIDKTQPIKWRLLRAEEHRHRNDMDLFTPFG